MSILYRLQQQRAAAKEAATQVKPQELSQGLQAQVQQAGLSLVKNGVVHDKGAAVQDGQLVKPTQRTQQPPAQEY
jgi:hypothetical protein